MMRSRRGPWTFFSTPMMVTLKSRNSVPSKTVRPTPTIPGFTSLSGMIVVDAGVETQHNAASADAAATCRKFMMYRFSYTG